MESSLTILVTIEMQYSGYDFFIIVYTSRKAVNHIWLELLVIVQLENFC